MSHNMPVLVQNLKMRSRQRFFRIPVDLLNLHGDDVVRKRGRRYGSGAFRRYRQGAARLRGQGNARLFLFFAQHLCHGVIPGRQIRNPGILLSVFFRQSDVVPGGAGRLTVCNGDCHGSAHCRIQFSAVHCEAVYAVRQHPVRRLAVHRHIFQNLQGA